MMITTTIHAIPPRDAGSRHRRLDGDDCWVLAVASIPVIEGKVYPRRSTSPRGRDTRAVTSGPEDWNICAMFACEQVFDLTADELKERRC